MISTFLSYRQYATDYTKSVQRTLANAQVAREQSYYRENIGKITSVDAFLKDRFDQFRVYCSRTKEDPQHPEYMYYTHINEDDQYDDLTILGIRKK